MFLWELEGDVSRSLPPAVVPLRPFCGVMGVAPAEDGEFRTRPPGIFGGNMDVRELSAGATLYLPVLNRGALFSAGDAHAAQGDGEVCINGMECPVDATLRFHLHKGRPLSAPMIETTARKHHDAEAGAGEWIIVESATDSTVAARAATSRMVDFLAAYWGFSEVHAYLLCSVAMNLRISQVVNEPMFTVSRCNFKKDSAAQEYFLKHADQRPGNRSRIAAALPAVRNRAGHERRRNAHADVLGFAAVSRFGQTENLHGIDEIAAFRKGRAPVNLARKMMRLDIVTFGRDFGSITLEFERTVDGRKILGRQSQVWVRLPEGWRIVSAHVSVLP